MENKLIPENLAQNGYQLIEELDHTEIVPFVKIYLGKKTLSARLYLFFNVLFFLAVLAKGAFDLGNKTFTGIADLFSHFSFGILIAFLLVPLHEAIHMFAYQYVGAKETSLDAHWKKLVFMAVAHRFVAGEKQFRIVAYAPFVIISFLCLLVVAFAPAYIAFAAISTCFFHGSMCSGDFALLSYFDFHQDKEVVTFDDKYLKKSWFWGKPKA